MNVKLTLSDQARRVRGAAQVSLDWEKRIWSVDSDPQGVWRNLSVFRTGKFEMSGDGVMCLVDESQTSPVRLFGSPRTAFDLSGVGGGAGRVFKPIDPSLFNAIVDWKVESVPPPAPPAAAGMREKLIARLRELLPCSIDDTSMDPRVKATKWYTVAQNCQRFSGTSCGSLPGFVSQFLGADPLRNGKKSGIDAGTAYMKKKSLSGTNQVRSRGQQFGGWVEADLVKRPKPGDIYALLDRDGAGMPLMNKKTDNIGHVGVIIDASGPVWRTADLGQGKGFEGKIDVTREYKADVGQLYGEAIHPGVSLFRVVAGWVDIEQYFGAQA